MPCQPLSPSDNGKYLKILWRWNYITGSINKNAGYVSRNKAARSTDKIEIEVPNNKDSNPTMLKVAF